MKKHKKYTKSQVYLIYILLFILIITFGLINVFLSDFQKNNVNKNIKNTETNQNILIYYYLFSQKFAVIFVFLFLFYSGLLFVDDYFLALTINLYAGLILAIIFDILNRSIFTWIIQIYAFFSIIAFIKYIYLYFHSKKQRN